MEITMSKAFLIGAVAALICRFPQDSKPDVRDLIDQVIADQDQRAIGVNKMSRDQRDALGRWITQFGATCIAHGESKARTYGGGTEGHWIRENIGHGRVLV